MNKPFEQEEYDQNDSRAKTAIRNHLNDKGIYTIIREDYNADIVSLVQVMHETEVKKNWTGAWPTSWHTVHIPERKGRLLHSAQVIFWVLKNDLTEAWRIPGRLVTIDRLEEVPNKKIASGEKFFCIPIGLCTKKEL